MHRFDAMHGRCAFCGTRNVFVPGAMSAAHLEPGAFSMSSVPRPILVALVLGAVSVAACRPPLACGTELREHETERICVCPNGGRYEDGFCRLDDGSVTPLDGMSWDGGVVDADDDAAIDDAGSDATNDACEAITFYRDADGDGFGDASMTTAACAQPDGYVTNGSDCDDACAACFPGGTEACDGNGRDEDCDGRIDEGLTRSGPVATIASGAVPAYQYALSNPMAFPGVGDETIVIWEQTERQGTAGETYSILAARVAPDGTRIGSSVSLANYAEGAIRIAAFARGDALVVVSASNYDFDWPEIGVRVLSRADLSETVPYRAVRRFSGAPSSLPSFGDLRVAPLDDRDALLTLTIDSRTYRFATAWNPPPASATTGPLAGSIGEGFRGIDLVHATSDGRVWIAYGDGTDLRVGTIDAAGELNTFVLGRGRDPVIAESGGRVGVLYIDERGRARFVSLAPGDPGRPSETLDFGLLRVSTSPQLALTGHRSREQWWVARVSASSGTPTVVMHDLVPSGTSYVDRAITFGAMPAGTGGVATSVLGAAAVLTITADSVLRGSAHGCY